MPRIKIAPRDFLIIALPVLLLGLASPAFAACPANTGNALTTGTDDQVSRDSLVEMCATAATGVTTADFDAKIGSLTETAPATDTASSGLNGRLQRVAQRLTSLIGLIPSSLGAKASSASLSVTNATEDAAQVGALTETAPATDTASSGLNGRLQRVAQRVTSLIALLPSALGSTGGLQTEPTNYNAAYSDSSVASATGSSQTLVSSSATRKYLLISNPSATTWWIHLTGGTAAANCAGCIEIPPGLTWTPRVPPTGAITGIGTATSKLTVVGG